MKKETFEFTGHNATMLPAVLWLPEGEIKSVLQITHGMTEHMGRYEKFAEYLCPQGIAVAGFDLRGHGKNPGDPDVASFGEDGWAASIEDMRLFFELLKQRFPEISHYKYCVQSHQCGAWGITDPADSHCLCLLRNQGVLR